MNINEAKDDLFKMLSILTSVKGVGINNNILVIYLDTEPNCDCYPKNHMGYDVITKVLGDIHLQDVMNSMLGD